MKHKSNSLRVVSMLLILVLVVGLLPMQAFAADSRTIYFDNTANWSTVYIYYWSDSNTGMVAWPGAVMSLESGSIYSYTIPGDATKVIFNIGSNQAQTSDLSIPASDNLYTYNTGTWSKYALACDHQWGTGVVQTPATCTQAGVKVYTCSLCSKTREEAIAASHNFVGGVCSVCGVNQGQRIFFKNTANWSTVKIYYWSSSNDHMVTWPGVEMIKDGDLYYCDIPGDAEKVIFNNGSEQTEDLEIPETDNLYTYNSGWSYHSTCQHSYSETITTAATCEGEGLKTYTCTGCGDVYTETIPALGHNYVDGICGNCGQKEPCTTHNWDAGKVTTDPTCTKEGVKTYTCTNCDETKTESIAALGHNYVDGVCGTCGMVEQCENHAWNDGEVIEPNSCWTPGTALYTCTRCGATEERIIYPGHDLYDGEITREPTCTSTGSQKRPCRNCTAVYSKTLPALGHDYVAGNVVAPTCTEDGYTVYTCSRCDGSENRDVVYHTGHNWSGNTCTICKATCAHTFVDGICSKCGNGGPAYVNGIYEIKSAAQLKWFAAQVNGGNNKINGKLLADIDLNGATWTAIGYYCAGGDSNATVAYSGIFDGNGHVVSNFTVAGTDCVGLFGYVSMGTIRNLGVANATMTGWNAGAVAGYALTSTVENCFAINCTITGYTTNAVALLSRAVHIGAVVGANGGTCKNSFAVNCKLIDKSGDMTVPAGETYSPYHVCNTAPVGGTIRSNQYYYNITCAAEFTYTSGAQEVTAAQLSSGEVAYKLQGTQETLVWGQTIGTDSYPVLFGQRVYNDNDRYFNLGEGECLHDWQAATCTTPKTCKLCGETEGGVADHSYDAGKITTDPTCTVDGVKTYTCGTCGATKTESVAASGHSYVDGICGTCGAADPDYVKPVVKPNLTLSYPTLNFKDVVYYNVYYQVSDMTDVVEMGLITFDGALSAGTIDDATAVISGYVASGSNYMVHTNGINAKNLGDALYFKVYAKLSDGSYVYSSLAGYHAVAYAKDILANSTNAKMKSLVVAMLNYGAAAQVQFEYKTDSLMNSFLTEEQKALVADYSADMVAPVTKVDSNKIGSFGYVAGGYSALYPSVSFEGAFSVKFYFTPAKVMDGDLTMYYWSAADYAAADVLTVDNATGVFTMDAISGTYVATVEGIAARQIDETIYVAGIYESNGVSYPTGVIAYSLGTYCLDRVANGTGNMPAFAKATIVYGNYAKAYFA